MLAHPETGAILAVPAGTAYALWLAPEDAAPTPLSTVHRWGTGAETDLSAKLGEGWFWGAFDEREPASCRSAFGWWNRGGARRIR